MNVVCTIRCGKETTMTSCCYTYDVNLSWFMYRIPHNTIQPRLSAVRAENGFNRPSSLEATDCCVVVPSHGHRRSGFRIIMVDNVQQFLAM